MKTITVRNEVYRKLLSIKRENESFSELFERLVEGANPLDILRKLGGRVKFKDKAVFRSSRLKGWSVGYDNT